VTSETPQPSHDPYAAWRYPEFRRWMIGNLLAVLGMQMQAMAVGWQIYDRTRSLAALSLIGLIQVLPVIFFALPAGHIADRFNRQRLLIVGLFGAGISAAGLFFITLFTAPVGWIYVCLLANGISRAFLIPAKSSFFPSLVPRSDFPNAVTWSMSGFQLSTALGPGLGGLLIAWFGGPTLVYAIHAIACLIFAAVIYSFPKREQEQSNVSTSWHSLLEGVRFLRDRPVLLSAVLLDMFAVLLGGCVSLLPVFAKDILRVGPIGLGMLEAMPAIGAVTMAIGMAHARPMQRAGSAYLWSVVAFGLLTIGFGISSSLLFSLWMLFMLGAIDNISVVVRHSLVQMLTPDAMRGRVSALNGMCIGISNELGGFESAALAAQIGAVGSVVVGGIGTILVVAAVAWICPPLGRIGRLDQAGETDSVV
jgi:MFS family permease